jgi:hypothetical protein
MHSPHQRWRLGYRLAPWILAPYPAMLLVVAVFFLLNAAHI